MKLTRFYIGCDNETGERPNLGAIFNVFWGMPITVLRTESQWGGHKEPGYVVEYIGEIVAHIFKRRLEQVLRQQEVLVTVSEVQLLPNLQEIAA